MGGGGGWRGRGFLLNGQTLLSVAKVICRQSINHITINNGVHKILFDSWPLPREFSSPVLCMLNIDRVLKTIITANLI